ncbi:MAG: hypothetical protein M3Q70_00340 [bacterium]|nr:hypothetical protein [bacterium]
MTPQEAKEVWLPINPFKRQQEVGKQIAALGVSSWLSSSILLGRDDLVAAAEQHRYFDEMEQQMAGQPTDIQVFNIG